MAKNEFTQAVDEVLAEIAALRQQAGKPKAPPFLTERGPARPDPIHEWYRQRGIRLQDVRKG